jgi:hypothetical protein
MKPPVKKQRGDKGEVNPPGAFSITGEEDPTEISAYNGKNFSDARSKFIVGNRLGSN